MQKEYSVRDICGILGVNRSSFYYQPGADPSEAVLRAEIEKLAGEYPRYGYRRITQLLVRQGYTVGTRRVARLMREKNLLVSIKRACRTTKSLQGDKPWSNRLENLEISRQDQVWVADITYIRLKGRFIYLCLLMAERLIRTLKEEEVHLNDYQSITEARDRIGDFITNVYNQKRPHSALGYLTPIEFQRQTLS
ncbi:hypothetical protein C6503_08825 [Candidatus Poribacteria bacterium]|nr:MAG: hypothetical protein C6503_08825 [Candidatus Poribacteria bacterium]